MTVDEALQSGQIGLLEAALRRVSFESTLPNEAVKKSDFRKPAPRLSHRTA